MIQIWHANYSHFTIYQSSPSNTKFDSSLCVRPHSDYDVLMDGAETEKNDTQQLILINYRNKVAY